MGGEHCRPGLVFFFFQAEDGIRDYKVTGVQTCALPIYASYRTDKLGREVKVDPKTGKAKKPQWRMTWLLDPSNAQAQATIKEIKDEAEIGRASCRERV